jgi:hypothetical protein
VTMMCVVFLQLAVSSAPSTSHSWGMAEAKITLVPGPTEASKTIVITGEDHTLGNSLRFMIARE